MIKKIITLIIIALFFCIAGGCSKSSSAANKSEAGVAAVCTLEPFVLNPASPGKGTFMKVSVALELSNPDLMEKVKSYTAPLRDAFIIIISTKTQEDLASQEGKAFLKYQLIARANQILSDGSVKDVYFTDFVMQ